MKWRGVAAGVLAGAAIASAAWFAVARGAGEKSQEISQKPHEVQAGARPAEQVVRTRFNAARPDAEPAPAARAEAQPYDHPPLPPPEEKVVSASEERDGHLARLRASGTAPSEFLVLSRTVEQEWTRVLAETKTDAKLSAFRCFKAGCSATVSHAGPENVETLSSRFVAASSFHAWPGGKYRSPPLSNGGKELEVTWVFFAPEAAEPSQEDDSATAASP